jgi:hypothetical protein
MRQTLLWAALGLLAIAGPAVASEVPCQEWLITFPDGGTSTSSSTSECDQGIPTADGGEVFPQCSCKTNSSGEPPGQGCTAVPGFELGLGTLVAAAALRARRRRR